MQCGPYGPHEKHWNWRLNGTNEKKSTFDHLSFPTANPSGISISFRCSLAFLFKLPSVGSGSGVSPGVSRVQVQMHWPPSAHWHTSWGPAMARKKRLITRSVPLIQHRADEMKESSKGYGAERFVTREVHGDMNVSPEVSRVLTDGCTKKNNRLTFESW